MSRSMSIDLPFDEADFDLKMKLMNSKAKWVSLPFRSSQSEDYSFAIFFISFSQIPSDPQKENYILAVVMYDFLSNANLLLLEFLDLFFLSCPAKITNLSKSWFKIET